MLRFVLFSCFLLTGLTYAADVFVQTAPPTEGFDWLPMVIEYLRSIPTVGPHLEKVFSVIAIIASVATALTACLFVILRIPQVGAMWLGAEKALAYLEKFEKKILPWLAYLSIFNVQKKKK